MPEFLSERDFVAQSLLPRFQEAAKRLKVLDVLDFHVDTRVDGGIADLFAERGGRRLFVVEAKFKKKVGRVERDIEPRDPDVIKQAVEYAVYGRFPFYLTCNTKRIILFQQQPGKSPFESEVLSTDYESRPSWAEDVMKVILGLVPAQLKQVDDTLVNTLHEAFTDLYPEILVSLKEKLRNKSFESRYNDWLESQGLEVTDETTRLIAEQSTYLQLNKLLFYHVLQIIYPDKLKPLKIGEDEDVADALSEFYAKARKIDYAPVYQSDVISEIPLTARAKERFRTLLDTMSGFDFSSMESDFIGRVYEKLIPPLERKRLGQFYTPPGIVDLIVQLTLDKADYKVLDPGCGSGSFLVRAYHKLRELNGFPKEMRGPLSENYHKQLLNQIYGVDINQFPAHLSVINLALQNPKAKTQRVNVAVNDFFNLKPGHETLSGFESITTEGEETVVDLPPQFDLVVANPPYIRQELLGEKEKKKIKQLVEFEYKDRLALGANPTAKRAIPLNKQSDIYIYFFIHGLKFLRNGGSLGFISSNKWLEVQYGEPFQQFLLSSCKIRYVIEFDRAVFPDAEVNTEVTVLEKADGDSNTKARLGNLVKFVHINKALPSAELIDRIQKEDIADDEYLRIVSVKQAYLAPGKWNMFLRSPPVYFRVVRNQKLKPLGELAEQVVRGFTTGYDPYFVLDKDKVKAWEIESQYLVPCSPPGRALDGLVIERKDIGQYFLMVREDKKDLKGTNVLKYIEFGEKLEAEASKRRKKAILLTKVETVKNRERWYELPPKPKPAIIFPMWFRYRYRPLVNNAGTHAQDFYNYIVLRDKEEKEVYGALLYCTLTQFFLENIGRQYSGMLHSKVYEIKQLPLLDVEQLSTSQRQKLTKLFWDLNEATVKENEARRKLKEFAGKPDTKGLFEEEAKEGFAKARAARERVVSQIDELVYDVMELPNRDRIEIASGLKRLREIRKQATRGFAKEPED